MVAQDSPEARVFGLDFRPSHSDSGWIYVKSFECPSLGAAALETVCRSIFFCKQGATTALEKLTPRPPSSEDLLSLSQRVQWKKSRATRYKSRLAVGTILSGWLNNFGHAVEASNNRSMQVSACKTVMWEGFEVPNPEATAARATLAKASRP